MSLLTARQDRGVVIYVTHLNRGPRAAFERAGIVSLLGEERFCKDVATAMARVEGGVMRHQSLGS